jgi:hypothetical protein
MSILFDFIKIFGKIANWPVVGFANVRFVMFFRLKCSKTKIANYKNEFF